MKRITAVLCFLLIALTLAACGREGNNNNDHDIVTGENQTGDNTPDHSGALDIIYSSSLLPQNLRVGGSSSLSDEFTEEIEGSGVYVYADPHDGSIYKLYDNNGSLTVVSFKTTSPAYAFFGLSVGDPSDDLEMILTSYDFVKSDIKNGSVFSRDGVSLTVTVENGKISSFEISIMQD